MTIQAFDCFKNQVLLINQQEKRIEIKGGTYSRISEKLLGLDNLYQIAIYSTNQEISQCAGSFLVTLQLKLGKLALSSRNDL